MNCPPLILIWARSCNLGAMLDERKIVLVPVPSIDRGLIALAVDEACTIAEDLMQPIQMEPLEKQEWGRCPALILREPTLAFPLEHGPASRDWQRAAWKGLHYGGTLKKRPKNKKARRR